MLCKRELKHQKQHPDYSLFSYLIDKEECVDKNQLINHTKNTRIESNFSFNYIQNTNY